MAILVLDGHALKDLFSGGLACLRSDVKRIDELNVFPVPDGDTGSNMLMTLEGAVRAVINDEDGNVGEFR